MATLHMPHVQLPHAPERLSQLARTIIQFFWVVALAIVLAWAFFVLLGALDPTDAVGVSIAMGLLIVLLGARAWAGSHRAAAESRDPRLIQARERRGF
jgi:uncharacterized membrane protein YdfJ with MMPL/SSD domain